VSKQIAALEEHLGAQLLMRTSRSLSLTEAGRDFFESAAKTIGELEAAESRIGHGLRSPTGRVRSQSLRASASSSSFHGFQRSSSDTPT
jgi:LysR family transcriptional regulator for bpeEF and oprC